MNEPAHDLPAQDQARELVLYEQPLHERMRTFLRLEFLFAMMRHHGAGRTAWETRSAVNALLDILAILGRGDVRSDVLKELERRALQFEALATNPDVDDRRLRSILDTVTALREGLNQAGKHFIHALRESDFLCSVRHRSSIPGGTCEFDLPDYHHWLNREYGDRREDINEWLTALEPLELALKELLWLTRQGAPRARHVAEKGLFQDHLEKGASELLRISLPTGTDLYPEISGSQHRFTIRFRRWRATSTRAELVHDDVEFFLARC